MEIYKIETGNFMLDGGALFGVVPKVMWEKVYPANERNLCNLSLRCLLVLTAGRLILIDTGIGFKQSAKFFGHYYLNGEASLVKSLKAAGFDPGDITDVLLTHLHFDHVGGAVSREPESGKLMPAFPGADYWVSRRQWQWAMNPNRREKASFLPENLSPLHEAGVLRFLEDEVEFVPGMNLRIFEGHTSGLIVPLLDYKGKRLVFIGDLIPTTAHIPVSWVCAYDTRPLISFEERETFLEEACREGYTLFFQHDLYAECCSLRETEKGIAVRNTFSLRSFLESLS